MLIDATIKEIYTTHVTFSVDEDADLDEVMESLHSDALEGSDFSGYDYSIRDYNVDVTIDRISGGENNEPDAVS